jgi:hypothetical protein
MPVPLRATFCGLLTAASVYVRSPVRIPVVLGVNTTPTVQVPPAATCVPLQLSLVVVKSPDGVTLVTLSDTLFGLVKVTVFGVLATLTAWLPKFTAGGEKVGFTRIPWPVRLTICGLLKAASVIVRSPVRVPVWLGVNTTLTTQCPLGARSVPLHPSLERLKSPEGVTLSICSEEELLGLVRVTFLAVELVPTPWFVNESAVGLMVSFAVPVGVAVGVAVWVALAVLVAVAEAVIVAVAVVVAVGVAVSVGVAVAVWVAVAVAVAVWVSVAVAVAVSVAVAVAVSVAVAVAVWVSVAVAVAVAVSVAVGVAVSVAVAVAVGVATPTHIPATQTSGAWHAGEQVSCACAGAAPILASIRVAISMIAANLGARAVANLIFAKVEGRQRGSMRVNRLCPQVMAPSRIAMSQADSRISGSRTPEFSTRKFFLGRGWNAENVPLLEAVLNKLASASRKWSYWTISDGWNDSLFGISERKICSLWKFFLYFLHSSQF